MALQAVKSCIYADVVYQVIIPIRKESDRIYIEKHKELGNEGNLRGV